jgi:hypothetical protein
METRVRYSEQVDAIILIESTFSFGAAALLVAPVVPVVPVEELTVSIVPVISTLWPTCGVIFIAASSASLYRGAIGVADVPLVPVGDGLAVAFASTN